MHLTPSLFLLFAGLVSASSPGEVKRDGSEPHYDLYSATNNQDAVVNSPASALEYTLSGGNPSVFLHVVTGPDHKFDISLREDTLTRI